jgi:YggT family protein
MFVVVDPLHALATIIDITLTVYLWIVIARAIVSWVSPNPRNPIVRFLHMTTEPILYRIRRMLPVNFGGIDFSPVVLIVGIVLLQKLLVNTLTQLAGIP